MSDLKQKLLDHILARHGVRASGKLTYIDYITFHEHLHNEGKWFFEHHITDWEKHVVSHDVEDIAYEDSLRETP